MNFIARTNQSFLGQWWWTVDRALLIAFLVLAVIGGLLVATASPPVAHHLGLGHYHFLIRHMIILVPALCVMGVLSFLNDVWIKRLGLVIFGLSILGMIAVLFVGTEIKGAQRWIRVLGMSVQPSEYAKTGFLVLSAWVMSIRTEAEGMPGYVRAFGLYILTLGLMISQPDFGMSTILTLSWASQIFLAGFPLRIIAVLVVALVVGVFGAYMGLDHVQSRVDRFLNPEAGDNYQVEQSIEAFQSGGILGVGPGQGNVKFGLPDAHADFIFAVAGEEMGFVLLALIIGIYGFIIVRGFSKVSENADVFAVLCVGGLLSMIGMQAFVHMGSSLNILPAKGMTLPLISYGGSSLASICLAAGIILALTRKTMRFKTVGNMNTKRDKD